MDEDALGRAAPSSFAPESTAANIRRYLDVHRSNSRGATSVVASLVTGRVGREQIESPSNGLANPAVRLAIDDLQRRRDSKTP